MQIRGHRLPDINPPVAATATTNHKPQTINHKPFKAVQRKDFLLMF
jgi:hypothetical protein